MAKNRIGLALSGGGNRAAVFHLGLLRRLALENKLGDVSHISTVSGGSLLVALVFSLNKMEWPSSKVFLDDIYPKAKKILTIKSLFSKQIVARSFLRHPVMALANRAELLANKLETEWGVVGCTSDLPNRPIWYINTTSKNSGKNWRFSQSYVGDWRFGHHYSFEIPLSKAAAASAAVPYAIGALKIQLPLDGWFKTNPATKKPVESKTPPANQVKLWDGGVYENLGIEPLYKSESGLVDCDFLIVSDAGAPLRADWEIRVKEEKSITPRLVEITTDQIRSLRCRELMRFFKEKKKGSWVQMGLSTRTYDAKTKAPANARDYANFLSDQEVALVAKEGTHLEAMTEDNFDRVARHGFEITSQTLSHYHSELFSHILWRAE
jgi:NTE family protein